MPAASILRYPHPLLKEKCRAVDLDREGALAERVARDLLDTVRGAPRCVGLAAPQIGETVRIVLVDVTGHPKAGSCHGPQVLVNPVLVRSDGDELGREGCLSIPDLTGNVRRATLVEVEALTPAGEPLRFEADSFEARVLQHELDHLDGILFLDRIASREDLFRRRSYG